MYFSSHLFLSTPSGWRATSLLFCPYLDNRIFLSTPSGWRATSPFRYIWNGIFYFYPRPPGGGRPAQMTEKTKSINISIHALRVEGDIYSVQMRQHLKISIHALRVEGDLIVPHVQERRLNFYPRPPGGGRQQKRTKFSSVFAQKGEEFASLRRGKRKICRWCFKKDKFWVLIWCEGSGKSVCASASHCG